MRRRDSDTPKTLNKIQFSFHSGSVVLLHDSEEYHEYIVDHFTTTLSPMLEKYLPFRTKAKLYSATHSKHAPDFMITSPRPKRHKRRLYCEGIITGTFCMYAVCLLLFTISNLNPLSFSFTKFTFEVDLSEPHNGRKNQRERRIGKESEVKKVY